MQISREWRERAGLAAKAATKAEASKQALREAVRRRKTGEGFMGDIKFSAFSFQQRRGAALRAGGWNLAEIFSLFESSVDSTPQEADEFFCELSFMA
jgi:hypothetical protein